MVDFEQRNWVSSVTRPDAFEYFWQSTLEETVAVPLNVDVDHVRTRSNDKVDVFDIHYSSDEDFEIAVAPVHLQDGEEVTVGNELNRLLQKYGKSGL